MQAGTVDQPGLAKAPHKSLPDKPPKAAVPTRCATSKYAHAESTSPAAHVPKFGR
jgi:hypothetical protein